MGIRIYELEVKNLYSCQNCRFDFVSQVPLEIEVCSYPCCSQNCTQKLIFSHLKNLCLSQQIVKDLLKEYSIKGENPELHPESCLISISKKIAQIGLLNIKDKIKLAQANEPAQKSEPKLAQIVGSLGSI